MIAHRHLAHPLEDDQLDFGDVGEVDERRDLLVVPRPHGIGTRSMMSWMTASVVRPWLAACGPSQMRWLRMYGREVLDVFRVDLGALALQQRPDLGEPSPADDRARRRAEVDAALDQLGRRVGQPVGVRVVGTRRRDQPLDVLAEAFVQEHLLVDARRAAR